MAYVAPNSFTAGTKMVAADIEQNIDDLQAYVNGGVSAGDIDPTALDNFFGLKHLMKGEYFGLINRYEFSTGLNQGTLGVNQAAGHGGNILGDTSGQQVSASGTGIDFYLEEDADVFIFVTSYPREYNGGSNAEVGLSGRTTTFTIKRTADPVLKKTSQGVNFTESEFGVNSVASNTGGIYALERRRPYYAMYSEYLTAGEHSYSIRIGSNERTVPIHFYQVSVYAYYRDTTV